VAQERVALPDPSDIAGRYEVAQRLGAGAFGTVYKAKDRLLGRMVAIKTIRLDGLAASGSGLDELLARFKREAQVSAQLKHPNIVTIYDIGEFEGLSYLAMEYIDGPGLDKVIADAGHLTVERAAAIGAQIADGLDYAHTHNVVHRDIKPANVMIEAGDRVKVTDFGIARAIDSGEHLTVTGSLLGTPSYMSPEQARGAVVDGRSDLFSVGCILYEMVTGKKAFRGDSITALIFKIITEEPQPISEIDPTIPEPVTQVIARALSKAPETRYQTGRELAAALLALASPGAIPTLRQVEVPTVATPTAHPPATIVQTAVARPPVPTRAATPTVATRRAVPAPAPGPAKRSSFALVAVLAVLLVGSLLAVAGGVWFFLLRKPTSEPTTAGLSATPTPLATAVAGTTEAPAPATPTPEVASATPAATPSATFVEAGRPRHDAPPNPLAGTAAHTRSEIPPALPAAPSEDYSFLDVESEEPTNGRELGREVASQYGTRNGTGGFYGTQRHLRQRPAAPEPRRPEERPGLRVTHRLKVLETMFRRRTGRYGTLSDLHPASFAPGQRSFRHLEYRFEVSASAESYRIMAVSLRRGLRSFTASSESDYITVAGED
jgi:hypothetical protein